MALFVLALVAVPGLIVGGILWASTDLRAATHEFLGHVRAKDFERAHAMGSASLRARVPPEALEGYLGSRAPAILRHTDAWINGFGADLTRAHVDVWLSGTRGSSVCVTVVKEGGAWRVDEVAPYSGSSCDDD